MADAGPWDGALELSSSYTVLLLAKKSTLKASAVPSGTVTSGYGGGVRSKMVRASASQHLGSPQRTKLNTAHTDNERQLDLDPQLGLISSCRRCRLS